MNCKIVHDSIRGEEILPEKKGTRTLVYPACGTDNDWIRIFKPDNFIGIDLDGFDRNPFEIIGSKTKSVLYEKSDARNTMPVIPKSDDVVLLLKIFWGIGSPFTHSIIEEPPVVTEEMYAAYQKENLECLKRYLKTCEENSLRRTFVVDFDGYGPIIKSQSYSKILSHEPNCEETNACFNSRPCEKAMPFFDWKNLDDMPAYGCTRHGRITVKSEDGDYPITLQVLDTYIKEIGPR